MSTGNAKKTGRIRVWPGVVFPLGLTLLLGLAAWQFKSSVDSRQEEADTAAVDLGWRAKRDSGELSARARGLLQSFVQTRHTARREQENSLRFEIRSTMDAVYRVLSACLEHNRAQVAAPVAVPAFPSGFSPLEDYLRSTRSVSTGKGAGDRSVTALRACQPELAELLPSGCSLAVNENKAIELFSIGGGVKPENSVSLSMDRDFIWADDDQNRNWSLHLTLYAPDRHPFPDAQEMAGYLSREMGGTRLENITWRGWLVGASGQVAAVFPTPPENGRGEADFPPFTDMPGEWVEIDGRRLVWLEQPVRMPNHEVTPVVAVSIARPNPPLEYLNEFTNDRRWTCTLGALALLALGMWVWFVRNIFGGRRQRAMREALERMQRQQRPAQAIESRPAGRAGNREGQRATASTRQAAGPAAAFAQGQAPRQRLVRDESRNRAVGDEDLIIADIEPDGEIRVSAMDAARILLQQRREPPRQPAVLPSGSLFKLQTTHRGGKGRPGSRVLDAARSPVLRQLARKIRPASAGDAAARKTPPPEPQTDTRPRGRNTERIVDPRSIQ